MPITDIPLLLTSEIGRLILTFVYCRFAGKHDAALQNLKNKSILEKLDTQQRIIERLEERVHSLEVSRSHCPVYKAEKN